MGEDSVHARGEAHAGGRRLDDRGPHHSAYPLVAGARDVEDGVLVLVEEGADLLPLGLGHLGLHELGEFLVSLEELQGHPVRGVDFGHVGGDQLLDLLEDWLVRGENLREIGAVLGLVLEHGLDCRLELDDALPSGGGHRHHGDAHGLLEDLGLHLDALLLGDVHHVEGDDDGGGEEEELGHEVEVPLEGGRVHDGHDEVGLLAQDKVPGYELLLGVGREGIGARQVHDRILGVMVGEGARLLLDGLAGPVAHVLIEAREKVEDRGFADVRLAREGYREAAFGFGFGRLSLATDADALGLAVAKGDLGAAEAYKKGAVSIDPHHFHRYADGEPESRESGNEIAPAFQLSDHARFTGLEIDKRLFHADGSFLARFRSRGEALFIDELV